MGAGERHGYHAWSLRWDESELLRRADPAGRSIATYASEEVFEPLGIEFYIGLPESIPSDRIPAIESFTASDALGTLGSFQIRLVLALAIPWSTASRAMNPFAWIYNHTGSVLLIMLLHGGFNTATVHLIPFADEIGFGPTYATLLTLHVGVLLISFLMLVLFTGGQLGYDSEQKWSSQREESNLVT